MLQTEATDDHCAHVVKLLRWLTKGCTPACVQINQAVYYDAVQPSELSLQCEYPAYTVLFVSSSSTYHGACLAGCPAPAVLVAAVKFQWLSSVFEAAAIAVAVLLSFTLC